MQQVSFPHDRLYRNTLKFIVLQSLLAASVQIPLVQNAWQML